MKHLKLILFCLCGWLASTQSFAQLELKSIEVSTYPTSLGPNVLVIGEAKQLVYTFVNTSDKTIIWAVKCYITSHSTGKFTVTYGGVDDDGNNHGILKIAPNSERRVVVGGYCASKVESVIGNHDLHVYGKEVPSVETINDVDKDKPGSVLIKCSSNSTQCNVPHQITVKAAGFGDAGCNPNDPDIINESINPEKIAVFGSDVTFSCDVVNYTSTTAVEVSLYNQSSGEQRYIELDRQNGTFSKTVSDLAAGWHDLRFRLKGSGVQTKQHTLEIYLQEFGLQAPENNHLFAGKPESVKFEWKGSIGCVYDLVIDRKSSDASGWKEIHREEVSNSLEKTVQNNQISSNKDYRWTLTNKCDGSSLTRYFSVGNDNDNGGGNNEPVAVKSLSFNYGNSIKPGNFTINEEVELQENEVKVFKVNMEHFTFAVFKAEVVNGEGNGVQIFIQHGLIPSDENYAAISNNTPTARIRVDALGWDGYSNGVNDLKSGEQLNNQNLGDYYIMLKAKSKTKVNFTVRRVLFQIPVAGSNWTITRAYNASEDHVAYAVDISKGCANGGTEAQRKEMSILAATDGKIIGQLNNSSIKDCSGGNGNWGNLSILSADDGYVLFYGHLNKHKVDVGEVTQNTPIGTQGNTGCVYGEPGIHLHAELRRYNVVGHLSENGWSGSPYNNSKTIGIHPMSNGNEIITIQDESYYEEKDYEFRFVDGVKSDPNNGIYGECSEITSESLNVYPNPAEKDLILRYPSGNIESISIMNMVGKKMTFVLKQLASDRQTLDVSQLKPGTYIIHVTHGRGIDRRLFVKK